MGGPVAHLEVVAGKAVGMAIIVEDELLIGRHAEGAGRLADDEEISRSHARVSVDSSGFCAIEDLGSTNGTYVNGLRISALKTLSEGDRIEIGGTTLVVRELSHLEESNAGVAPPPPPVQAEPDELSVRVELNFAERYATLQMGGRSEPLLITFDGRKWRVGTATDSPELEDPGTPPLGSSPDLRR